MKNAWNRFWSFLSGKKTYLLAALLTLVVLVLLVFGRLTPTLAFALLLFAVAGFGATFRSALAAHQQQALQVLTDLVTLGIAARAHNKAVLETAGLQAVKDGAGLASVLQPPPASSAASVTS